MTTLAARLVELSGLPLGAATMAEHLLAIVERFNLAVPSPPTVSDVLLAYSELPAGQHTVTEHLAVERAQPGRRGIVISRAWLQRMRAQREALRPARQSRRKTRRELDEEADELERFVQASAAQQAEAEAQARVAIERAAAGARRSRRRQEAELLALLSH